MADLHRRARPALHQLVPENAPFDEEQRAWLNGFLAGLLGLAAGTEDPPSREQDIAPHADPEPPPAWRSPSLGLNERLALASAEDLEQRLCAALAQLDCGQCGSSCESYAHALATGTEKDVSLCAPGGAATVVAIESLLQPRTAKEVKGWAAGGVARRWVRGETERPLPPPSSDRRSTAAPIPDGGTRFRIKSQRKLTLADAGAEVREVVLEPLEASVHYRAGDNLAVFPHNDPDLVRSLLRATGTRGQEVVMTDAGPRELWRCLLEDCDITHVRRETLELFSREAGDRRDAKALRDFVERGSAPGLDLLDLLGMFEGVRPSIDRIVATLAPLAPRIYAIASSPSAHPGQIHLVVRMMKGEVGGRERKGVASHFLGDGLLCSDDIGAAVHMADHFALPNGWACPMIMLAGGTGIARYRGYLQELAARGRRGGTWLIVASSREGDEALYESELKAWCRQGVLEHLDVIKMGQRGRRLGPHDILRKRARRVTSWLERGGVLYACGEAAALGTELPDTLIDVLARQGKRSLAEASDFVQGLRRERRYVEELY